MVKDQRLNYEAFFESLVGTPTATDAFREHLATGTREGLYSSKTEGDYYNRLTHTLSAIVHEHVSGMLTKHSDISIYDRAARNIKVGGVRLTVNALRGVGNLYERHARDKHKVPIPQYRSGVERSVAHALGFMWSLASRSAMDSAVSIYAAQAGVDPSKRWRQLWYNRKAALDVKPWGENLEKAFVVKQDAEGQVELSVRHRPLRTTREGHCPAIEVKMPDGSRGLWQYLNIIGEIAATEIYSRQFPIVDDDFHGRSCPVGFADLEQ